MGSTFILKKLAEAEAIAAQNNSLADTMHQFQQSRRGVCFSKQAKFGLFYFLCYGTLEEILPRLLPRYKLSCNAQPHVAENGLHYNCHLPNLATRISPSTVPNDS
jgi:hypothetical protein